MKKPNTIPIEDLLSLYQQDRLSEVQGKHTLQSCVKRLSHHLRGISCERINKQTIISYVNRRHQEGIKNGTIRRELVTLRAALHWGHQERIIPNNQNFRIPVPDSPPKERWLTREEAQTLLSKPMKPHIRLFIVIALQTGARKSAILELTWDRVNFANRTLDFGKGHRHKRRAVVPMTQTLYNELSLAYRNRTSLWVVEWGGDRVRDIQYGLRALFRKQLGWYDVSAHTFRHTVATWLAMDDTPTRQACRFLNMTEKTFESNYAKHSPSYLAAAANSLNL